MKEEYKRTSKFVDNDILRYFYGEMSEVEKNAFENALMVDKNLRKSYKELTFTLGMLPRTDELFHAPEPEILNNILAFSKTKMQETTLSQQAEKIENKPIKLRKFTPKPIIVGMAILLSVIVNFSGYSSQHKHKQATNKKIKHDALEWENLDNAELQKLYRDISVIKEHRGGIIASDSAVYEVVTHEENTTIVLP